MTKISFKLFILITLSFQYINSFSQDILKLISGDEKIVRIVSKAGTKIEYKDFYNDSQPSVSVNKNEVLYVQHPDGKKEYFDIPIAAPVTITQQTNTVSEKVNPTSTAATATTPVLQNTSDLKKGIDDISKQLKEVNKTDSQLLTQILEALNNINTNIISLKSTIEKKSFVSANSENTGIKNSVSAVSTNITYSELVKTLAAAVSNQPETKSTMPEPELDNIPYQLKNNEMILLERVEGSMDVKVKGAGFGGTEMNIAVFGTKSSMRFNSFSVPKIYIRFDSKGDPTEKLWLLKAIIAKDKRRFLCSSMSMTGSARDASSSRVDIQFKPAGNGLYEIIIPSLQPGEYTFTSPMSPTSVLGALGGGGSRSSKISCFGID